MTNTNTASGAAMQLADQYAAAHAKWALEDLYGTSKSYTAKMLKERHALRSQLAAALASAAAPAQQPDTAYAALPMQFACSGVHPVYSADQMRAFADGTHALRTQHIVCREFLERMLSAMEGVIDVADRQTDEFEALRSCVVDLTLMLFKPEALRASRGQAPAQAAPAAVASPGWKLVPVEPTIAQRAAAMREGTGMSFSEAKTVYCAMLAAAPTPPAQASDSVLEDAAQGYERRHAIRQGHEIATSDAYFEARPQIDSNDHRKVFQAGFERGWDAAMAAKNGDTHE